MEKFAVNYDALETDLRPRPQVFRYEDVKDKLKKVAFDVVKFKDSDDISGLWQIQQTEEGEVIVARYDDSDYTVAEDFTTPIEKVATNWSVFSDKLGENIHVFYKRTPVAKIALASIGIPKEDADIMCSCLPEKLATNKTLVSNLLAEASNYQELVREHPELMSAAQDIS